MKKRIFIGINFPEKIKNSLASEQQEIDRSFSYFCGSSPIKWTRKENLHLTLFFTGYLEINDLPEVFKIVENTVSKFEAFDLKLGEIIYAPLKKIPPKMVWVNLDFSEELARLQKAIQAALLNEANISLEENNESNKNFSPHITLGRIIQWQWSRIEPEEIPQLEKNSGASFGVKSIEVMESELKRGGAEYTILKSINLKD